MKFSSYFKLFVLISACFLIKTSHAQLKGWSIEPTFNYGRILKHTESFNADITENSWGTELAFNKQTFGKQRWNEEHRYPMVGFSLLHFHYGDHKIFGSSVGAMATLQFYFIRKEKFQLHFRAASGLGYATKIYDVNDNPLNNVIGGHVNSMDNFRVGMTWHIHKHWAIQSGINFTHLSNASAQAPNLGINIVYGSIGIRYTPNPVEKSDYIIGTRIKEKKRFGFNFHQDIGVAEEKLAGGPKYLIHISSLALTFRANYKNRVYLGSDFEFNQRAHRFVQHTGEFGGDAAMQWKKSTRWTVFVGNDIIFGDWSLYAQMGIYTTNNFFQGKRLYTKLAARYFFPEMNKMGSRVFAGLYLKTHFSVAEYVAVGVGFQL